MEEKIIDLLEEKFTEEEFQDCFWLDVKMLPNNKLEIYVDADSGITFRKCQRISRYLEQFIDEEGWLGEKYVLEVSSPGTSRPLKLKRQYPKNVGRKLKVKLNDGSKIEGKLIEVDDEQIILETKERRKVGKRKVTETIQHKLPFSNIEEAIVQISFK